MSNTESSLTQSTWLRTGAKGPHLAVGIITGAKGCGGFRSLPSQTAPLQLTLPTQGPHWRVPHAMHKHIHTHTHALLYTHACTLTHKPRITYIYSYPHRHTHSFALTHTVTHMHIHTHTHIHTITHMLNHMHAHTHIYALVHTFHKSPLSHTYQTHKNNDRNETIDRELTIWQSP